MYNRGNYKPPKVATKWSEGKPCGICGQPILSKHLSKDTFQQEYEKKWCVHWACQNKITGYLDRTAR